MTLDGFVNIGMILQSGIYALIWRREVVYVGKSKTMLVRIYSHRSVWGDKRRGRRRQTPSWSPIKGVLFDDVWVMPTPLHLLDEKEREMIAKYRPRYNIKLVPKPDNLTPLTQILGLTPQPTVARFERRV